jgi:hypothetical protein
MLVHTDTVCRAQAMQVLKVILRSFDYLNDDRFSFSISHAGYFRKHFFSVYCFFRKMFDKGR